MPGKEPNSQQEKIEILDTSTESENIYADSNDLKKTNEQEGFTDTQDTEIKINNKTENQATNRVKIDDNTENSNFPVHIMGEINKPGVYYVKHGDIVDQVVNKAGGLTEKADLFFVNLADEVMPNQKIYIPSIDDEELSLDSYLMIINSNGTQENKNNSESSVKTDEKININLSDEIDLQKLNGIGPSKAADIVNYRQENGEFSSIEEIMNVPGIKENTFEKIKNKICIN